MFSCSLQFDPASPHWAEIPAEPSVFALFGADPEAEPYLSRTPNLRNRLRRLLDARPDQSKRLRLAQSTARIEYSLTGSEFEAQLLLYDASLQAFGDRARKRLHLRPPVLLRMSMENAYPRVYVTNKVTNKAAANLFGPWPSRAAAETFLEAMLNLFDLRRCVEDLHPDPLFPGCVYSEMKKCLAPCFKGCTNERYAEEAAAVHAFLATHGESRTTELTRQRDQASADLDFERAAELHTRLARVEAAAALMPAAVHALVALSGVIIQPSSEPDQVLLFQLAQGCLTGPVPYSVLGMRHQNEQSGSSSLFAQPMALQPVPLDECGAPAVALASRDELESRLDESIAALEQHTPSTTQQTADHLCLFARWYYRPQTKRVGEVCFAQPDGALPKKALLRAISRVYRDSSSRGTSATSGQSGQSSA
ncbi:MAG TPA: UvrB/UvrC motif-containing protein [Acidobacteriaceae bacterium]|nr:UvrB/UvrC motif-containing protein [Acidobacteriaceae bacterium]